VTARARALRMIVAGVMSGTSADGVNVALVKLGGRGRPPHTRLEFLGHAEFPYPKSVRLAVLGAMNSPSARVAELSRLNFLLGELYAEAVVAAQKKLRLKAELVGCHGQTLYHQGAPAKFLGRKLAVTWQTGEPAVIAARVGVPVVSDFRPADMAAGGKGAPLVPLLDYLVYRAQRGGRIAQNIGGIANLTAIPAGASLDEIIAFDTGPGNMVIDALADELFGKPFDRDGKIASAGTVLEPVLKKCLRLNFFRQQPPKTAGREEFGREFAKEFLTVCGGSLSRKTKQGTAWKHDVISTATALTARSIADAVRRSVLPRGRFMEMIVSGGGTKNRALMEMLGSEMQQQGLRLRCSNEFGIPSEAKEAVAFAVLAYETWNRRPSNVPSATGAKRAVVLGKVSLP
jgi:anhydro-N-acetylmuramic acid kinase